MVLPNQCTALMAERTCRELASGNRSPAATDSAQAATPVVNLRAAPSRYRDVHVQLAANRATIRAAGQDGSTGADGGPGSRPPPMRVLLTNARLEDRAQEPHRGT